ncbi:polysaccharide pyruvyl transferase [Rhizobium phaseoli]|uniref:polysaccharide pyruvyl transferase family protein n=1 Tax=Rhizobium phaseoli TaxID=396 RepID=UPI000F8664A9|nr:polysaccharide pyruvyl transferase family protein [Rhizobium phaseoli]RUM14917.1 polysaccharide pyruvyl transferase [Rhizobium phaseoli]
MLILIENTVCLNAGDAAIMLAIMRILRRTFGEQVEFVVFDSNPEISAKYYTDTKFRPLTTTLAATRSISLPFVGKRLAIRLRRNIDRLKKFEFRRLLNLARKSGDVGWSPLLSEQLRANIGLYAKADLIVSTGGTYLVEHYDLSTRLEEFEKDLMLRKPLVLFTQSLGPFNKPDNRNRIKSIIDQAKLTLLRDVKSEGNLRAIGVEHDRLKVISDSVFAFADMERLSKRRGSKQPDKLRVAVSVRDWAHFDGLSPKEGMTRYKSAVSQAISALVKTKNAEVTFLSTCQGIPEYHYDDSIVAQEIANELDVGVRRSVFVDSKFYGPDALLEKVADFDFVISTRMHMAILSLCAGVPVLPISYEFKTTELYNGLSQSRWVTDISHIDPTSFTERALEFTDHLDEFFRAAAPKIREQSLSAWSAGPLIQASLASQASQTGTGVRSLKQAS